MITFSANNNDFYSGWNKTIERYNSAEGKKDFNEKSRKLTNRANLLRQRRDAKFAANKAEGDILVKNSDEHAPVDAASKKGANSKVSFGSAEADRLSRDKSLTERNRIIRAKRDRLKNEKAAAVQAKLVDSKDVKPLREASMQPPEAVKELTTRKNRFQHVKMNFDPNAKRISGYPAYAKDVAPLRRGALSETVFENGFNPENMKKVPSTEDYVKSAYQIPRQVAEALNDSKYNTTEVDVIIHRNLPGDGHFTMSPVKPEYIEKNAQERIEPALALKSSSYEGSRNSSSRRAPSTAEMPAEPVAESVKTSAEALPKNSSVIPGYEKVAKAGEVEWIIAKDGTLSPKTKNIPGFGECLISKTNLLTVDRLTAKIVELCKKTPDAAAQILADFQKVLERRDTTNFQIDLLLQKFLKELAHSDTLVSEKSLNKKASIFAKNVNPNLKANALRFVENARKVVR